MLHPEHGARVMQLVVKELTPTHAQLNDLSLGNARAF
jgi:hypothetical protein